MESSAKSDKLTEVQKLEEKLQWVNPDGFDYSIGGFERFKQRMISNPFVPLGFIGAIVVLKRGLGSVMRSDARKSQLMMRWRVGLQGATIVVMIAGMYLHAYLKERKKED